MNILLIAPYHPSIRPGQFLAPPLGLYRIKSFLERKLKNIVVDILDVNLYKGIIPLAYLNKKYAIIGSSLLEGAVAETIDIQKILLQNNKGALSICGGHAVTGTNILKLLSGAGKIDLAVIGFGEYPLLGLVEHFDDYKEQQIGGICWLENGKLHINPPVSLSQDDFNGLCQINYSVIPYKNYWEFNSGIYDAEDLRIMKNANTHQTVRINTSSHCNIGCTFCSATNFFSHCQTKQKILNQDTDSIISTIENILASHPETETIFFNDDNFINSKKKIFELEKKVISHGLEKKVNFICLSRLDTISAELLQTLKKINTSMIIYGIESFDMEIIRQMKKSSSGNYIEKCKMNLLRTIDIGITPLINIILFHPSATKASVIKTINETLFFIQRGTRVGLNILVEIFEGAEISRDVRPDDILVIGNHRYLLPKDVYCREKVTEYYRRQQEFATVFGTIINLKGKYNLIRKNLEVFYSFFQLFGVNTNLIISVSQKIINHEQS